jgi:glucosamine--fructose-6-phosphate aminotransferase (isomerizing)
LARVNLITAEMCGIVGIVSSKGKNIVGQALESLKRLEYRGYDSAGISIFTADGFKTIKSVGKIKFLEEKIPIDFHSNMAIAHTRWATHGKVSEKNAHPHLSQGKDVAIIHNGIIENYTDLRNFLAGRGFSFYGETDSEVIANLVSYNLAEMGNLEKAFPRSLEQLAGSYSIALMCKSYPDKLFVAKNGSPLLLGTFNGGNIIASSQTAFVAVADNTIALYDGEYAIVTADNIVIFDSNGHKISRPSEKLKVDDFSADRGAFEHYMLKEIYEQPDVLRRTLQEYVDFEKNEIVFKNFSLDLREINFLTIVACGTSYHAGCIAKYFIEDMANIFVNVDIASEFRYRTNPMEDGNLAIFISQSGETADTIAALRYCRERKQRILSIVNVLQSAMASMSDIVLKTMAGTEIGVASTKAFTAQVSLLYMLALEMARKRNNISTEKYHLAVTDLIKSVEILEKSLEQTTVDQIKQISKVLASTGHIIYIGRDVLFPMALEGALKIREISYIPTQGIASGELKHGTLALVDPDMFVIALNNSGLLYDKNSSSIEEIFARNGKVIVIGDKINQNDNVFSFIETPETRNKFEILLSMIIPLQLLAYYSGTSRKLDIDQPRNLAKSVTVE